MSMLTFEAVIAIVAFIFLIWLIWLTIRIRKATKYLQILKRESGKPSVVDSVNKLLEKTEALEDFLADVSSNVEQLKLKLESAIVGVSLVRYNPFKDTGGNLSFSLALLDEKGKGVVITSLNSRTDSRFYCKPISGFSSEVPLSDEEKEAIKNAAEKLKA